MSGTTDDVHEQVATLPDASGPTEVRRAGRWRRVGIAAMVVLVLVGLSARLDPRRTVSEVETGDDVALAVEHASVIRSGQPTPLNLTVTRPGGFEDPIRVRLSRALLDRLDFQNWYPTPADETGDPNAVTYEFDPPDGDSLEVRIDARAQPNQLPTVLNETVEVLDQAGDVVASVNLSIPVLP